MDDSPPPHYCPNCGSLLIEQDGPGGRIWVCPSCGPESEDVLPTDLQEFF